MSLLLSQSDLRAVSASQASLLEDRLDDAERVRRILTGMASLIGAARSFAVFMLGHQMFFIQDRIGPQIEAYFNASFLGFDEAGNTLLADKELEEINRRRREIGAGVHHESRLQLREKVENTAYFQQAFAPAGMHHVIGISTPLPLGEAVFAFGFEGPDDPGFTDNRSVDLLELILPAFKAGFAAASASATAQAALDQAIGSLPNSIVMTGPRPTERPGTTVLPGPTLPDQRQSWLILESQASLDPATMAQAAARFGLTPRQTEVMSLLVKGYTTAQIAAELNISPHTARRHCEAVLAGLGIHSRSAIWSRLTD